MCWLEKQAANQEAEIVMVLPPLSLPHPILPFLAKSILSNQNNEGSQPKSSMRPQLDGVASIRSICSEGSAKSGPLPALDGMMVTSISEFRFIDA